MKKVFNTILALLLLLGVMGCSDGIKTSELNVPSRPEVKGVEIPLDAVPDASSLSVKRKDKGATDWSDYSIQVSTSDLKKDPKNKDDFGTLVDYFVEPGKEYEYEITFDDPKTTKKEVTVKATDGFGEYGLNKETQVSNDDKTGIMTFSPNPRLNEKVLKARLENVKPNEWDSSRTLNITVTYKVPDTTETIEGIIDSSDGNIKWFLTQDFGYNEENFIGKTLNLETIELYSQICGFTYRNKISLEKLKSVTPILPETISFNENIFSYTPEATNDGIKIKYTPLNDEKVENISLYRKYKTSAEATSWSSLEKVAYTEDKEQTEFIDYFVEPGYIYSYEVHYTNNWPYIDIYYPNEVTATTGLGHLVLDPTKKAEYDPNTGIMTFPQMFGLQSKLDQINAPKFYSININYHWNQIDLYTKYDNKTSSINWLTKSKEYDNSGVNVGEKMNLYKHNSYTKINYILINETKYTVNYNGDDFYKLLPEYIIIPEFRNEPSYKNTSKGIEFITPYTGKDFSYIKYDRTNADGTNFTSRYRFQNELDNSYENYTIKDYNVEPGEKYIYSITLGYHGGNHKINYKPVEIIAVGVTNN